MDEPWTVKHRPTTLNEVAGNDKAKKSLISWLESWKKETPHKKAALLHGPPGAGKTVTSLAAAHDLEFDVVEINASDRRNAEILTKIAGGAATQADLYNRKKLILLDEIDGINLRSDSGAIGSVVEILEQSKFPIVLTANDPWDPRIRSLRTHCLLIEFKKLGVRESLHRLRQVSRLEGIDVDDEALRIIHDRNSGDMRSMINDLQTVTSGKKRLTLTDVEWLGWRDRKESIFRTLATIFSSKNSVQARRAVDSSDINYEMLYEWIYENAPLQLTDPLDLANAMEFLAKADIYLAEARRSQSWRLLPYALDMMSAGVATSKVRTRPAWTPMRFPQRIMKLSATRGLRATQRKIAGKVSHKTHVSSNTALSGIMPYLRVIFDDNPKMASDIEDWLNLEDDEIMFLKGEGNAKKPKRGTKSKTTGRKVRKTRRKASSA